jgi:hypothetical protein
MRPQRGDETLERSLVGKFGKGVEERQLIGVMRLHKHGQHLAAEQACQYVDVDQEVGPRGDPSRAVERDPSTWYDHVLIGAGSRRRSALKSIDASSGGGVTLDAYSHVDGVKV